MHRRLRTALPFFLAALGCSTPSYVPEGKLKQPLSEFDRIDVRALVDRVPRKIDPAAGAPPSPEAFLQGFRRDLTNRLHRRRVFNLPTGPMLVVEATLLRYEHERRVISNSGDYLDVSATVEIDVAIKDESGTRLGGGKSTTTCASTSADGALRGAEKRAVAAIGDYLRKSARRGSEPEPADPDESP